MFLDESSGAEVNLVTRWATPQRGKPKA